MSKKLFIFLTFCLLTTPFVSAVVPKYCLEMDNSALSMEQQLDHVMHDYQNGVITISQATQKIDTIQKNFEIEFKKIGKKYNSELSKINENPFVYCYSQGYVFKSDSYRRIVGSK